MTTPTNNPSMTETAPINLEDLALLFMHTDDAVCAIDAHQRILYWNQAAEDTLGFASAEVIGRPCYAVFQGQKPDKKRFCHPDCPLFQAASAGVASSRSALRRRSSAAPEVSLALTSSSMRRP